MALDKIISSVSGGDNNPMSWIPETWSAWDNAFGSTGEHAARAHDVNMMREQQAFNAKQAQKQRWWSAREAGLNRDFQKEMSNTAVQRRMEDLRKAGINPLISAKFDASSPAGSMPSGASASSSMAHGARPAGALKSKMAAESIMALSSSRQAAVAAKNADTQLKQVEANVNKVKQEISNLKSTKKLTDEQVTLVAQQIHEVQQKIRLAISQTRKTHAEAAGQEWKNIETRIVNEFLSSNEFMAIAKYIGMDGAALASIIRTFFGKTKINKTFNNTDNSTKTFNKGK